MNTYFERMKLIKLGLLPKEAVAKTKKPLKKVSDKKAAEIVALKASGGENFQDAWFEARRKEMTGRCVLCQGRTEKDNDDTYRNSIAHILPKKDNFGGFPSVAIHPVNWVELCFYGNSCHTNFDNKIISWELIYDSREFEIFKKNLKVLLPLIPEVEQKNKVYSKLMKMVYTKG